jgi:phosphate transport system permease protein
VVSVHPGGPELDVPIELHGPGGGADRVFRLLLTVVGSTALVVMLFIAGFLIDEGFPALTRNGLGFFTSDHFTPLTHYGILGVLVGSLTIALLALGVAWPLALSVAILINEYAPPRARRALIALVDLLAAIPSIIYGMWGILVFVDYARGFTVWLATHANFIPLFRDPSGQFGNSLFLAGLVVAPMVIPIVAAISREVMSQTPAEQKEAALALGGTRWGMITTVVLPFSRSGITSATLLGFGRAFSETIAVSLIVGGETPLHLHILAPGGGSIAALIVEDFTSAAKTERSALILAGLTLFTVTLVINTFASYMAARSERSRS